MLVYPPPFYHKTPLRHKPGGTTHLGENRAAFGLGHRLDHPPNHLSGGERNRLHLAKLLKEGGNVLLLDEPTNDLDVETLRALEEALLNFPGSALVISHDRWFLDRVATHILAFEDDGEVVYFEGNFSEYDEDHKQRKGDSAMVPQRMKYKKLA